MNSIADWNKWLDLLEKLSLIEPGHSCTQDPCDLHIAHVKFTPKHPATKEVNFTMEV